MPTHLWGARRRWIGAALAAAVVGAALTSGGSMASAAPGGATLAMNPTKMHPTKQVCARPSSPKRAACMAVERTDVTPHVGMMVAAAPSGFGPSALQSAYALPSATAGSGQTVAIVDAYDDPSAEADLATYRSQFGLPACTTANGCFSKVDQRGGNSYPAPDSGWSTEISLDVDMVSAICPQCHILLVESDDNSIDNLAASVDEAVALGAKYVSNSYAASGEDPSQTGYDVHYDHPGVAVTASTGDAGYGVNYPASSPFVTAVGGTSLTQDTSARGWSESAWSGAGSGCSQVEDKPVWQDDAGCAKRTNADISAVADPNTGVAVYDSYQAGGWNVYGGTSVSSPIIASAYALAGPPEAGTLPSSYAYDSQLVAAGGINDVTSGSNGSCVPDYLCTGTAGYDGPTGLGTPSGIAALVYRDHGHVAGTITDAATGTPMSGVTVGVPGRSTTTDSDGHYDLNLPVGTYQLTASRYLYQSGTTSVTVTKDATVTADLALTPTPRIAVAGVITDGSGHGWPLYAKVTASDGTSTFSAFTDPATGRYVLNVPQNENYTVHVSAEVTGYDPVDEKLTVGSADVSHDVALSIAVTCDAPGYQATLTGTTQTFDTAKIPNSWTVTNVNPQLPGYSYKPGWVFTNPGGRANATGGSGNFAIVDSDHAGQHAVQDTTLTSPGFNLTGVTAPALQFGNDLRPAVNSTADIDLSVDGGATWTSVWHKTGFPGAKGPNLQVVPLPQAAGKASVKVRFHYTGSWSQWWAIDNVFVGNRVCSPIAGGLVVGHVTDASTGAGIDSATVTSVSKIGEHATTTTDGFYALFSTATGAQEFTAAAANHSPNTATAAVTADHVTRLDVALTPNA